MSPTLLELVVAILLLVAAWKAGVWIAPSVLESFVSFWRDRRPPVDPDPRPNEKNITPPAADAAKSPRTHDQPH